MGKLKKLAKTIVYNTLPASYICMFHHVTDNPEIERSKCRLEFKNFEDFISSYEGHYATLNDVVKGKKKNKIAITFDDGLSDLYTLAYPLLKEKGIPFTVFIITDFIDTPGYLTSEQLKIMSDDPLVTVGSHGATHEVFTKMDTHQKRDELLKSRDVLQKLINKKVECFAYSHGQYDSETLKLAKCYEYAVSTIGRPVNLFTRKRFLIPRFNIDSTTFEKAKKLFDKQIL